MWRRSKKFPLHPVILSVIAEKHNDECHNPEEKFHFTNNVQDSEDVCPHKMSPDTDEHPQKSGVLAWNTLTLLMNYAKQAFWTVGHFFWRQPY